MSFISILKKVGQALMGVEHAVAPIATAVFPALGPEIAMADGIFTRLQTAIMTVEANSPVGADGALKSAAVINDFNAGIALAQPILATQGKKLAYDADALQEAINAQVAAYNAMAKVKASVKIVAM